MEGGGIGGNFSYGGNYQRNYNNLLDDLPKPTRPPLTAIDRFLWGHDQNHFSQPEILTNFKNKGVLFSSSSNVVNYSTNFVSSCEGHAGEAFLPLTNTSLPSFGTTFVDGVFLNEQQNPNWMSEEVVNHQNVVGLRDHDEENSSAQKTPRGRGKREKGGGSSSAILIKGQWTDEEDSKLKMLVKHFGVKKWAQIAEKMKDSWSEEEEMLLVEAHMQVGNKWAEIAKRIPGRTENSIKNHWNATKRRQNSRRKIKKSQSQNLKNQSTLLQDYIKTTSTNNNSNDSLNTDLSSTTITPTNSATNNRTPPNSTATEDPTTPAHFNLLLYPHHDHPSHSTSDDHSPSYLAQNPYDDEMNFMQGLFAENAKANKPPPPPPREMKVFANGPINHFGFSNISGNILHQGFGGNIEYGVFPSLVEPNLPMKTYQSGENQITAQLMYSDLYLSQLLDGPNAFTSHEGYPGNMNMENMVDHQAVAGSSVRKEADLMEIVSSNSQFSRGNANNSFVF
ncbi:hypothetical protein ACH5RR_010183 [Cinchona calisaya]|uniref:Uncharacterized protein n=1 Tax=Cinchona calisaya TaxID=153742 RepID=A0ABD3AHU5_9GENT